MVVLRHIPVLDSSDPRGYRVEAVNVKDTARLQALAQQQASREELLALLQEPRDDRVEEQDDWPVVQGRNRAIIAQGAD